MRRKDGPCVDEIEAIRRCQRGDMAGLDPLVARYQTGALRLAYLLTGDHALAEDITQDSFLQMFRTIGQFDVGRPLAPWLYRIVTNMARERLRSRRRLREVRLEDAPATGSAGGAETLAQTLRAPTTDPAMRVARMEERDAILDALATLTQKQREAIILRYYLSLGDHECAAIVGCREGAFRVRLHDGLRALKLVIRQQYPWLLPADIATNEDSWKDIRHVAL